MRTNTACRVLVLSRQAYQGLLVAFPLSIKTMLDNVLQMAESVSEGLELGVCVVLRTSCVYWWRWLAAANV